VRHKIHLAEGLDGGERAQQKQHSDAHVSSRAKSGCAVCSFMASGRCGSVCEVYWPVSLWCEECQDPTSNIRQRLFALVEVVEENLDGTTLHSIVLGPDEINDCRSCAYKQ
jgi:hypothetical protein